MNFARKYWLVIALVVVLTVGVAAGPKVVEMIRNVKVLGMNTPEDANGGILVNPSVILESVNAALKQMGRAPIDLDTLALARALRSEHGSESRATREWVGWAIKNSARGGSLFKRLTTSRNPTYSGFFARQRTDARYAATNQAARVDDIEVAILVVKGTKDPTNGATNFFSPKAQDALFARAQAGDHSARLIKRDGDAQRAKWISEGLVSKGSPPGVDPRTVEFFGKVA